MRRRRGETPRLDADLAQHRFRVCPRSPARARRPSPGCLKSARMVESRHDAVGPDLPVVERRVAGQNGVHGAPAVASRSSQSGAGSPRQQHLLRQGEAGVDVPLAVRDGSETGIVQPVWPSDRLGWGVPFTFGPHRDADGLVTGVVDQVDEARRFLLRQAVAHGSAAAHVRRPRGRPLRRRASTGERAYPRRFGHWRRAPLRRLAPDTCGLRCLAPRPY